MHRPIHFELHVTNPEQAIAFYEKTFGWKFTKWDGPEEYWLVQTGEPDAPGINGGLMRSRDGNPRTVNTIAVPDVDRVTQSVQAAGGQVVLPKMPIPGVGWLAYCTDPSGNIFGVMHDDKTAR